MKEKQDDESKAIIAKMRTNLGHFNEFKAPALELNDFEQNLIGEEM